MQQIMTPDTVKAAFDGQALTFGGERFTMHKRGDEYWTTIESLEAAKAAPDGRDPEPCHVRMGMVTGLLVVHPFRRLLQILSTTRSYSSQPPTTPIQFEMFPWQITQHFSAQQPQARV